MKIISVKFDNILIGFLIFVLLFITFSNYKKNKIAQTFSLPIANRIVLIDAGHGGFDSGARFGKTFEKKINLAIAKKLQNYLELGGATVLMTRADDSATGKNKKDDMFARKKIANGNKADIFVSIHQNASPNTSAHGIEVYFFNKSPNSKLLSEYINKEINSFIRPTKKSVVKSNHDYYVLKQTNMPAVLVECGFISNSYDRAKITSKNFQEKIAWSIYLGITNYFNEEIDTKSFQ